MPYASALTRLQDPELKAIGQTEVSLTHQIAYDETYTGFAFDIGEGARMARILGDKNILFLANHGVIVLGTSNAEAYDRLYYLERACQVQLYAMWTGRDLKYVEQPLIEHTRAQFGNLRRYEGKQPHEVHFEALKRLINGIPPKPYDA